MAFFDPTWADIAQHIALPIEVLAIVLIFKDLKSYQSARAKAVRMAMVTPGFGGGGEDQTPRFWRGLVLACIAVTLETYQLLTLYFA